MVRVTTPLSLPHKGGGNDGHAVLQSWTYRAPPAQRAARASFAWLQAISDPHAGSARNVW